MCKLRYIDMKTEKEKLYVYQYNTHFELIKIHNSMLSAAKEIGISYVSIYKAITGERNLAGGYFWHRGSKPPENMPQKWADFTKGLLAGSRSKPVLQMELDGTVIAECPSIRSAAKSLNVLERGISLAASGKYKTAYGYRWMLKKK